ncbi:MAG: YggS family pyridoxal phosphate-dependent enzyme [Firmicutes bacterium]|nr:YggS family pyridoxal phosphate-dependent enzyme [Bacillota bacterium]MDH7496436.1 YggS family pyridoxal phosphate-dependent enzyme [Bacillota bacterium]
MTDIAFRIQVIQRRIREAAAKAGRDPRDIGIVAVTKNVQVQAVREAVLAGISTIGENRVQEAVSKFAVLGPCVEGKPVAWHFIGHLQTNKVRLALDVFSLIHSLDSWKLACEIQRVAEKTDKTVDCLLEINVSGKQTRFGADPAEAVGLAKRVSVLDRVRLIGVMAIAPVVDTKEEARPYFRMAREICGRIRDEGLFRASRVHLSMGMTQDFEVAVEEGSTLVRIGTGIFGPRREGAVM